MARWNQTLLVCLMAYAVGCFATGYYLVRARTGQDIRTLGSGNVGARNVGRILGARGFIFTFIGDFGKGALAVWVTQYFSASSMDAALAMLAVVAGHIWPLPLRFCGGKGVATSLGALLLLAPSIALAYGAAVGMMFAISGTTKMPGLFAYLGLPVVGYWFGHDRFEVASLTGLMLMVVLAHRKNLLKEFNRIAMSRRPVPNPQQPNP